MSPEQRRNRFSTTRWTLVVRAAGTSAESAHALAELCSLYWYPVYSFIRRSGHSSDEAGDLTQAFFTRVLEKHYLRDADPLRGRFRSFLIAALRHFISNERDWHRTAKRGGSIPHVPLEIETAERRYVLELPDTETPEHIFERQWALAVLDEAMVRLAAKYADLGKAEMFARLRTALTDDTLPSYGSLAQELGTTEGALRVAVHRLRREFGIALRSIIAETVATSADVDDELRHLLTVVSARR
jgi:RNA polymerase sigma-70 factor (ECF subfamily)